MHLLLIQLGLILGLSRLLGGLFGRLRQPYVVGEMVAGILLGPSVFGAVAPAVHAGLFPEESLPALHTLSQAGLLLFMFLVGLELDPALLRGRMRAAVVTSLVSILAPFVLGVGLAFYLHPYLTDGAIPFAGFALFMGAAMSVTAFPVLSRILAERNLLRTRVGVVTVACAAVDDVSAWLILAGVVAFVQADGAGTLLLTLAGVGLFAVVLLRVVHPMLRHLEAYYHNRGRLTQEVLGVALLTLLGGAAVTEWLGVHALFGAFLVGTVMPKDRGFVRELRAKLEDVTVVLLLPLFFVYAGLHTEIGLLDGWTLWLDALLILLVAIIGKFGGSAVAARATGLSWRDASALGVLMNTRGLMELVILSIGLELGVIPPVLFAMMVLMALATTLMTTPVLGWIYPMRLIRQGTEDGTAAEVYTVLIPVSLPSSGRELLRVASVLAPPGPTRYYALHLVRARDQSLFSVRPEHPPHEVLQPLREAANLHDIEVRALTFVSRTLSEDLLATAEAKGADLIVMGWHKPVVSRSVLGGMTGEVMRAARADVVVYVARGFEAWQHILVPYHEGVHDRGALEMAQRIAARTGARLTVLYVTSLQGGGTASHPTPSPASRLSNTETPWIKTLEHDDPVEAAVEEARLGYDLIVVGADERWEMEPSPFSLRHERLATASTASLLIVRKNLTANQPDQRK